MDGWDSRFSVRSLIVFLLGTLVLALIYQVMAIRPVVGAPPGPLVRPTNTPAVGIIPTSTAPVVAPVPSRAGPAQPATCGIIADFEQFEVWKRGDEANGTLTQSSELAHTGRFSAKLAYNFPTPGNDYVVFLRTIPLGGHPTALSAWVYGDASGHYLNFWIRDSGGEVWSFTFGQIRHYGWLQMVGLLDPTLPWPTGHISGPAKGVLTYPVSLVAIVLDDAPDAFVGSGTIYIDDLSCEEGRPMVVATPPTGPPLVSHVSSHRIAFTWDGGTGNPDIYSINPDGSGLTRLTQGPGFEGSPAWSPDGTRILYQCCNEAKCATDLCVMNADGSNVRKILQGVLPYPGIEARSTWSPDGRMIAFTGLNPHIPTQTSIYIASADGQNPVWLVNGRNPSWSPDGTRIAFADPGQNPDILDIFVINVNGTSLRVLTNHGAGKADYPTWTPNGTQLSYCLQGKNLAEDGLHIINADGSGDRRISPNCDLGLDWSPDGSQLAISSFDNILLINFDGSNPRPLAKGRAPSWSRLALPLPVVTPPFLVSSVPSCHVSLMEPANGSEFGHRTRNVVLRWQMDRSLEPNEYFFVNVPFPHGGGTWYDGTWRDPSRQLPSGTRNTEWTLRDYLCLPGFSDTGEYSWYVEVRRQLGTQPEQSDPVSCKSETWTFRWSGCRPTPTPTPEPD